MKDKKLECLRCSTDIISIRGKNFLLIERIEFACPDCKKLVIRGKERE